MEIGYTFHAGDLFHVGHLHQIRICKEHLGIDGLLVVGILTDEAIEAYKRKPIIPLPERVSIYGALRDVDLVIVQLSRDPTENLEIIRPNVLFHGDDWDEIPGSKWMYAHGGRVVKTPYLHGVSTSDIIKRCKNT